VPAADQGDLWSDTPVGEIQTPTGADAQPDMPAAEPEIPATKPDIQDAVTAALPAEPAAPDLDSFIADLPPPVENGDTVVAPAPARTRVRRHATAATSLAVPAAPDDEYVYEDDYYDEPEYSMLRNPYVLAGLAVAVAIVAAVFVVVLFGSGGDDGGGGNDVITRPLTPQPGDDGGIKARSIAIAAVREGPGRDFFEIGLLRTGNDVSVVGRNADSTWYEIIYPGSNLEGWVPASALKLPENAASLISVVSFTPIPKPSVIQPTAAPTTAATEQAQGAPDLELATLGGQCQSNEPITLALRNVGNVPVNNRQVNVIVTTAQGVTSQSTMTVTLAPGQAVPVSTGQVAQPPRTTISVVFTSTPLDSNPSNNVVVCTVGSGGGGGPSGGGTAVPPPIGGTPANNN
jgi:hypothetical protein